MKPPRIFTHQFAGFPMFAASIGGRISDVCAYFCHPVQLT
uniref:Uncharacterized protein n=1 Tax=Siphoviridae sp. ctrG012 TaxID=2826475 RepID=A0A8S5M9W3_9CAUD|nr:MAG TPA: hypothetical protein [Siphoviridae sp. ctrG012]DAU71348.1 MAG TPA: hypothetical protein [Caudoviricetes sp.]